MISEILNFFNHPEKGGQMTQIESVSSCTSILVTSILKWEKKTSLHVEILSFIYKKKTKKEMKWDENENLHWIMRWGWMRWKWNLAFNNDDSKKNNTKTIYKNYLKK